MLDIKIEKAATLKAKPTDESKLGFGNIFTDHMFVMEYDLGVGWHDARIVPYAPFPPYERLCGPSVHPEHPG